MAQRSKKSRKSVSPKIFSGTARGQRKSAGFPAISSSNLSSATKRNSNANRRCCFFFDFRMTSNYRPEGSRGNACDRRLVDASYISRAAIFANHRLLIPLRLLIAKGHAPLACSLVNALTTAHCRYQPFARKRIGASYISRAAIFANHRLLIPLRLLIAKGHAPLACSLVNALTTAHCRYQPSAGKQKSNPVIDILCGI